jgi:hypothetical protein
MNVADLWSAVVAALPAGVDVYKGSVDVKHPTLPWLVVGPLSVGGWGRSQTGSRVGGSAELMVTVAAASPVALALWAGRVVEALDGIFVSAQGWHRTLVRHTDSQTLVDAQVMDPDTGLSVHVAKLWFELTACQTPEETL